MKVGNKVTFSGCHQAADVLEISNDGKTATLLHSGSKVVKRVSSLKLFTPRGEVYWNEQERAESNATFKDGSVAYSCLSGNGNGFVAKWKDGDLIKETSQ